jgi:hypothetical protein
MKEILFIGFALMANIKTICQADEIDYFGQDSPNDSAVVFAADIISLPGRYNQNGTFSPDGNEFCFSVSNSGWYSCTIYHTKIENEQWLIPEAATFLSGDNWDPFFSPDSSNLLYCHSGDIWMLEKEGNNWINPVKLDFPVSSSSNEWSPSMTYDGTIYFFSRRDNKIYYSVKENSTYSTVEKVKGPINDFDDREPFISKEGDYLIFNAETRTGCIGSRDLYISYRNTNRWTNPKNLGAKINSESLEFSPNVTPDGKYMLFSRRNESGSMIFWVNTNFIDSLKNTNFVPYVNRKIPDTTVLINEPFYYTINDSAFIDDDGNETLMIVNETDLPGWLNFNDEIKTFSGTPTTAQELFITISAIDTAEACVSDIFRITVENPDIIKQTATDILFVSPNPATNRIYINNCEEYGTENDYQILDIYGRTLKKGKCVQNSIDISSLSIGIYILKLRINGEIINNKIIKYQLNITHLLCSGIEHLLIYI